MQHAGVIELRLKQKQERSEAVSQGEAQIRWLCRQGCPMPPRRMIWQPATRQLPNAWVHEAKGCSPQRHCGRSQAVLSDSKETVPIPGKEYLSEQEYRPRSPENRLLCARKNRQC